MIKFKSLNKSDQFKKILNKKKLNSKYFNIYFNKNLNNSQGNSKVLNISFVMKKNLGNAVTRNRIKRKLKAAVQKVIKEKYQLMSIVDTTVPTQPYQLVLVYASSGFSKQQLVEDLAELLLSDITNIGMLDLSSKFHC